jgi:hypothetical protein
LHRLYRIPQGLHPPASTPSREAPPSAEDRGKPQSKTHRTQNRKELHVVIPCVLGCEQTKRERGKKCASQWNARVRNYKRNCPVFISWRSSGREAGEKQPLEASQSHPRESSRRRPHSASVVECTLPPCGPACLTLSPAVLLKVPAQKSLGGGGFSPRPPPPGARGGRGGDRAFATPSRKAPPSAEDRG